MTLEQGANLAEIFGVIVVVVTLIYLSVQVRQGTELLRSESRQALVTNDLASLSANFNNADVFAKYVSGEELSAEDQLRLSFMFTLDLRNREFEYFQYANGLLDEQAWLAYRHVVLVNHSAGLGRSLPIWLTRCWSMLSQTRPTNRWPPGPTIKPNGVCGGRPQGLPLAVSCRPGCFSYNDCL